MYMEIEFERLSGGYRFDVLEDASSRVDGSRVWKNDEGCVFVWVFQNVFMLVGGRNVYGD
jgi:hypothetical protein